MPFSFPASPSVGATSQQNGREYRYAGNNVWELVAASGGGSDARWDLFLPSAPTGLTVTGGNGQASLSWTAPTGVIAQAPITDYREQYSTDSGTTWTTFTAAASTATSATVTSLTNGTAYVFRVAAVNGVGVGSYTAASAAVTPTAGTPPNAPTALTATAGNAQLSLAWSAPSAPGTSAITGYTVEYTPSGGSAATVNTGSTATSYTLTGLTNGTSHSVRVRAVSAAGNGDYSTAATGTPSAASVPGAVASFSSNPGTTDGSGTYNITGSDGCSQGFLVWTPPSSDGGSAITGYTIAWSGGSITIGPTFRRLNYTPLNRNPYGGAVSVSANLSSITVRAVNSVGEGATSTALVTFQDCD
jgi:hypothetical protein